MSSIYSKEQVLTNKHCSPNLKYINTVMSLELVIISVAFEYWLFFERTEKNLLFMDLLTNLHFVSYLSRRCC